MFTQCMLRYKTYRKYQFSPLNANKVDEVTSV